jgi:hypothetical protein
MRSTVPQRKVSIILHRTRDAPEPYNGHQGAVRSTEGRLLT